MLPYSDAVIQRQTFYLCRLQLMHHPRFRFLLCLLLLISSAVQARTDLRPYGLQANAIVLQQGNTILDSAMQHSRYLDGRTVNYVARPHHADNYTLDFYLLLGLCFLLGAIKTLHPKYFNDIWRAFINPTLGSRQLKEIIETAAMPNLLMNLFSTVVIGTYVFYLISIDRDMRFTHLPGGVLVSLLILGATVVYLFKHAFIRFTGWAFNIRAVSDQYNFNIFLVNKILGMALLPFIICFAFLNSSWDTPITICSVILLVLLILNRYLRSWNIFAQFFMNSRFHFFMYLCAFEILPLAILMKLVLRIL